MSFVFLSYSHLNMEEANRVREELEAKGLDVWQDEKDIKPGELWLKMLDDALGKCSAFMILISIDSIASSWVTHEARIAYRSYVDSKERFLIVPLIMHGVSPNDMPTYLKDMKGIFLSATPTSDEYRQIAKQIAQRISFEEDTQFAEVRSDERCPFAGLASFDEHNADFYFGRNREIKETTDFFCRPANGKQRWLQIDGPSGVGKSSLVKAGIIPKLNEGRLDEPFGHPMPNWLMAIMRPGYDPVLNLAEALAKAFKGLADAPMLSDLNERLQGRKPDALRDLVRQYLPDKYCFLLVVDQLEEVFTQTRNDKIRKKLDALVASALRDRDGRFYLITTIRSDFPDPIDELPRLGSLSNRCAKRYRLKPIGEKGLFETIDRPMHRAKLEWDEGTLREQIVKDASDCPNALPLVSNLMMLLWQQRDGNKLQRRVYQSLGGVGGALAESADRLINSLGTIGKRHAKALLLRLVKISYDSPPTRRTISRTTALRAAGGGLDAERVLNRLAGGTDQASPVDATNVRLIVISERAARNTENEPNKCDVELAHEALLTNWATLKEWIDKNREQMIAEDSLENRAKDWEKFGKLRFPGIPSRRILKQHRNAHSPSELAQEYLGAVRRQILRRIVITNLAVIMVMSTLFFFVWIYIGGITVRSGLYLLLARAGIYYLQPTMVSVPAGRFTMGSPDPEASGLQSQSDSCGMIPQGYPAHEVVLNQAFQMGKYEVTFDEYEVFARLSGNVSIPSDYGWGRGRRPVIGVSWDDAVAYAQWLSKKTGKQYRLPTEAEWEYAARAYSDTAYWWGPKMEAGMANCGNCGNTSAKENENHQTAPVGSFPANNFGLHDTAGNVWEWVQDCWHLPEIGEHHAASAWEKEGCKFRVLRGGSWDSDRCEVQSATRQQASSGTRFRSGGFRLAR